MKKAVLLILGLFLQADVLNVVTQIKNMENYAPEFKKIAKYDIFGEDIVIIKKQLNQKKAKKNLILNVIFQNRANINGLWVKKGDDIEGYKVVRVFSDGVVLKNDKEIKKIILISKILKVAK